MAAGDAPATTAELRTDFLEGLRERTGVAAVNTIALRYLNKGLQDMHLERHPWTERRSTILTRPEYTTGTVTVTQGATAVTGASTLWTTANAFGQNNARVGDKIVLGADLTVHVISAVGSATSITLTDRFTEADISAGSYAVFADEYALPADCPGSYCLEDMRFFDENRRIELIGAQEFYLRYARNARRSFPLVATVIELGPSGSTALRPRVLLHPAPDQAYLIPFRYHTTNLAVSSTGTAQANLTADTDEPIVPLAFRQGIVLKALARYARERLKDTALATDFEGDYTTFLLRARARVGPADDRPRLIPRVAGYRAFSRRPYRRGSRRVAIGTDFDQLRD